MGSLSARQWLILLSVQFTTILFGLTATSVTIILPQLKGALSANQDQISWVLTFNLVATAIATPLTGWLAATLGWRTLMVCSVAGFTAASMLCGLVDSLEAMLALRVVQGAFGAPIFPMGQTILLASFHRQQHPFIIMMWGVGGVMGPILGPTFGGLVSELLNWRWTFFLILPLGMLAALTVVLALTDREKGTAPRFDLVAARGLGNLASFCVVAQLTRLNPRLCLCLGLGIQAAAGLWMGSLGIGLTTRDVMWSNILHGFGFGFGLCYTPMAVLSFSTLQVPLMTQGNALFSLIRMLGSSIFVSLTLVVFAHSTAAASVNLNSSVTLFTRDLLAPWIAQFGDPGGRDALARLASEIQRQASMIGFINAFHLLTLVPLATVPLVLLFVVNRTTSR